MRLSFVKPNRMVAAGVTLCLLAGGCGSARAGGRPGSAPGPAAPGASRSAPTAAGNRQLARKQARQLITLVQVPGSAVRLRSVPRALRGPALGTPGVSSLIDQARSWRVAMPFAQTAAWLAAHRPHGLHSDGSASGSGPGTTMTGTSYKGARSPAWQSAELEIGVAPAGHGTSVVRADGVVVWLDPRPVADTVPGRQRMRVTVAGGCPDSDARHAGVTNRGADLRRRLLPAGRPTAGLECRYYGLNGRLWQLRKATRLDAAAARREAGSMARLPLSHTDGGVMSCPADDGSAEVVVLSYPRRADVDLWIDLGGCASVSNGYIAVGYPAS